MLVNVNGINLCIYVNKRVEFAQRGIALWKIDVLLLSVSWSVNGSFNSGALLPQD